MTAEAYSVAVKVSLLNHVTPGLLLISKGLNHAGMDADKLNSKLASIGKQAAIGAGMLVGGLAIASLFKAPLEEAKKFQTETARFNSLGFGDSVNQQAVVFARGMKTIGTSANENLTLVSDAMAVFKDLHHAEFAAPLMAKMKFANEAVFGSEAGGANERKFMDMLKVVEFRGGLSSDKEFATQADFVQKVISGSRNRVDATQLLTALKTGGVALSRRNNEQFYLGSEPLIQEFGGSRYGTGAMSIYQNLVQSRGTITAQQELYRLGLLNPSMVEFNKAGRLKKSLPGAFKGSATLENEGELALLEKVLLPAFQKKGIVGEEAIMRELGMILGNRTGSGLMSRIYQQRETLHKQIEANKSAMGIDPLNDAAQKTLAGKELDFTAKWHNLMLNLGNVVLPLAIKALDKLNPALEKLGVWMQEHPEKVKSLTYAFIGLSAVLAVGGIATMLIAITRSFLLIGSLLLMNPIGLAIVGITLAALALWNNWKEISTALSIMWFDMKSGFIQLFHGDFLGAFKSFSHVWLLGWQTIFNTMIAGANAILPAFMHIEKLSFANAPEANRELPGILPKYHFPAPVASLLPGLAKQPAPSPLVAPVPSRQSLLVQLTQPIHLDGKKIAESVTKHQAQAASRPNTGTNSFDPSRSMLMPGTPSAVYPRG
jgi:hypothetical protein